MVGNSMSGGCDARIEWQGEIIAWVHGPIYRSEPSAASEELVAMIASVGMNTRLSWDKWRPSLCISRQVFIVLVGKFVCGCACTRPRVLPFLLYSWSVNLG